ncbi:MAG TPA: hypothetical protein VE133_19040 [Candidatus Sulfotelmatobacter sp.]|jgi:hypothetical protein|nr:hypothetical protein [Candidatus Sulfotelmatobacter sp.]
MFAKNSRYARLPESSPVDAQGERLRGKDLRRIPFSTGTFLHTVQNRDRLDLLGMKYYSEPTKWWQICDANPQLEFPLDLLNRAPVREETFGLVDGQAEERFNALVKAIIGLGTVRSPLMEASVSSLVVLSVTPALRAQVISQIAAHGLHFVRSFAWVDGMNDGELFYFEDRAAKMNWRLLLEGLTGTPGVLDVQSQSESGFLSVIYNSAVVRRESILGRIMTQGYALEPALSDSVEQVGKAIVIPPNQTT